MKSAEIEREFFRGQPLWQADIDWLKRKGVPTDAIAYPVCLSRDRAFLQHNRFFEFERNMSGAHATPVFTFLTCDSRGDIADIVAWAPWSQRLFSWLGIGLLGQEQAFGFRTGEELAIYFSPLDWLRDHRQGVCVVDEPRACAVLFDAGPLLATTVAEGERLHAVFLHYGLPQIRIPASREIAA